MATYNKFEAFVEDLAEGKHNFDAAGDVMKIYATNATPSASLDAVKADLAEITPQNGYPAGGSDIQNATSRTGGTLSVTAVDVTWTASGGSFGPFQWVPIYNDTQTSPADPLVCWYADTQARTITDGSSYTIDFGTELFTLT